MAEVIVTKRARAANRAKRLAKEMIDDSPILKSNKFDSKIKVVDIDVPFFSLVMFMVKVAIAAVPASIIVLLFWVWLGAALLGGVK